MFANVSCCVFIGSHRAYRTRFLVQDDTGLGDYADGIAMADDGSVVVVGATLGDWSIPNVGGWDMAAFKLDADGALIWKWQVT